MKTIPDNVFIGIKSVLGAFTRAGTPQSTRQADAARRAGKLLKRMEHYGDCEDIDSQNRSILEYLQSGRGITSLEAIRKFRCTRLSARIYDLRKMGHRIISIPVSRGGKRFVKYCLDNGKD